MFPKNVGSCDAGRTSSFCGLLKIYVRLWVLLLAPISLFSFSALASDRYEQESLVSIVDSCSEESITEFAPGSAVSVVLDNELALSKGYGRRSVLNQQKVDENTLFKMGSVQKMMTAAAVLTQVDTGNLTLNELITNSVPEVDLSGRWKPKSIKVKHLLDHSSGIPTIGEYDINCGGDESTLSEWAASLGDSGLQMLVKPGQIHNYSNAGYSMAGLVAERAAGIPYKDLMAHAVWRPAGMFDTFQTVHDAIQYGNVSHGHAFDPHLNEVVSLPPDAYECWWTFPAGDGFTTAEDLARWSIMLMSDGGKVLSPMSAHSIISPSIDTYWLDDDKYGYGTYIRELDSQTVVYHGGSVPGWSASQIMIPQMHFSVSVLSNGQGAAGEIAQCIVESFHGLDLGGNKSELTPPETWREYTGLYLLSFESGISNPAIVHLQDQKLFIYTLNPPTNTWVNFPLQQLHKGTFMLDLDGDGAVSNALEAVTFIKKKRKWRRSGFWLRNTLFVGDQLSSSPHFIEVLTDMLDF